MEPSWVSVVVTETACLLSEVRIEFCNEGTYIEQIAYFRMVFTGTTCLDNVLDRAFIDSCAVTTR